MTIGNLRPKVIESPEYYRRHEVFRTPNYSVQPLLDYFKSYSFEGEGYDPSAGDGRMMRLIHHMNPTASFHMNDIRPEEEADMRAVPNTKTVTIGDYLAQTNLPQVDWWITNPPFTLTTEFVDKATTHTSGPIFVLQSMQFLGAKKRLDWFKKSGLTHVLQLVRRPIWEIDGGVKSPNNVFNYVWMVFQPNDRDLSDNRRVIWDWLP